MPLGVKIFSRKSGSLTVTPWLDFFVVVIPELTLEPPGGRKVAPVDGGALVILVDRGAPREPGVVPVDGGAPREPGVVLVGRGVPRRARGFPVDGDGFGGAMPARDQARTCRHSIAVLAGSVGKGSLSDVGELEECF